MKIAGDMMEAVASEKIISISSLVDGNTYKYDPDLDKWFDDEGVVYLIPHEYKSGNGRKRIVHFHTETHKWIYNGVELPTGESAEIDSDFKNEYGLNGEVELFAFGKKPKVDIISLIKERQRILKLTKS